MRRLLIGFAFMIAAANAPAADTTLKIASIAPDGTLWMKEMRAAGEAVARETEGRVAIKFYPGGVMGNDAVVLRKIRLGQLQGGAFTGSELTLVYRDAQLYSLPFLFKDYAQVDVVRAQIDPLLVAGFEQSGFRILGISGVGFAYLMGTQPIHNREDLRKAKVWVPQNDHMAEITFRSGGVEPIPLPLGDVFTSLQTGLVDTVGNTAAGAIALQWHTKVKHLFDLPLSYVVGYVALDEKVFAKMPESDRAIVMQAFGAAAKRIDSGNRAADASARVVLKGQGVVLFQPDAAEAAYWNQIGTRITEQLLAEQAISPELLARTRELLATPAAAATDDP